MPPDFAWLLIAANLIVLLAALIGFGRWAQKWLVRKVSEPIEKVVSQVQLDVASAKTEAERANYRLDRHLEGHSNG